MRLSDKQRTAILSNINSAGIFVTCGRQTPNVMVTHNGTLGKMWGRDIFALPIKSNKYSYQIVTQTKSFAINVPKRDIRDEIARCDIISGFSHNKFEELGLHVKRARAIDAYVLGSGYTVVECNVIAIIPPDGITQCVDGLFTGDRGHTFFIGEIADAYEV